MPIAGLASAFESWLSADVLFTGEELPLRKRTFFLGLLALAESESVAATGWPEELSVDSEMKAANGLAKAWLPPGLA